MFLRTVFIAIWLTGLVTYSFYHVKTIKLHLLHCIKLHNKFP